MTAWKRIGLYSIVTGIASFAAALLVCHGTFETDFAKTLLGSIVVIVPCWLILLPMVVLFRNLNAPQAAAFIALGALLSAAIIVGQARYFFVHSPSNRMPDVLWFRGAAIKSAAVAAVACSIYVLACRALSKPRQSQAVMKELEPTSAQS